MRELKYHEKKLLKKVDFLQWRKEKDRRDLRIIRTYFLQDPEDYHKYNKLVGNMRILAARITMLPAKDPYRHKMESQILSKLYDMGLLELDTKFSDVQNKLTVSAFCRRRLAVVMVRLKMCQYLKMAVTYIEQGHVRVGVDTITDPAYLVVRHMEDYVTWVDSSKIKRHVMRYNDELDDYDML
ncbi:alpha-L RNA-binding motif-containing protein [Cantharellus anzutake]|uniref:alpha-L RNA-binding motif-containing protein n=1 Tax=Cantharellus anzutake TaxID=1750568 RepID=UPI0019060329|nr:alpha-L RNA-binding motif-containing protein [Cantharellus anzutake]KAF8334957.1 alpha-L RNA-binding motif-containing protein [Cantharellus anzutake]